MTPTIPLAEFIPASLAPYWHFMGEFHPAMTHFPIALIMLAAFLEVWSFLRRRGGIPSPTAFTLVWFGMLGAIVAAAMGWANVDATGAEVADDSTIQKIHRWLGVGVAAGSLLVCILALFARRRPAPVAVPTSLGAPDPVPTHPGRVKPNLSMRLYQVTLIATTVLVSLTGMYGGKLTYGADHYTDAFKKMMAELKEGKSLNEATKTAVAEHNPTANPTATPTLLTTRPSTQATTNPTTGPAASSEGGKVNFVTQIKPLFDAKCVECHNEKKVKGDWRMDTRELAFKMGDNEKKEMPIVPGKSGDSLLVKMVIGEGDYEDVKMPPKGKPLTPEQIALVKKWIDEGAEWPDAVTLSKE